MQKTKLDSSLRKIRTRKSAPSTRDRAVRREEARTYRKAAATFRNRKSVFVGDLCDHNAGGHLCLLPSVGVVDGGFGKIVKHCAHHDPKKMRETGDSFDYSRPSKGMAIVGPLAALSVVAVQFGNPAPGLSGEFRAPGRRRAGR